MVLSFVPAARSFSLLPAAPRGLRLASVRARVRIREEARRIYNEIVKREELPEKMRKMTLEQKQKWLDEAAGRRAEIAKRIQSLGQRREGYVEQELKRKNQDDKQSFDRAVRDAVRKQAEAKGFTFEKAKDA